MGCARRGAAAAGGARLRRAAVTRALAAGALERAMDAAAALEVRGYARARRRGRAVPAAPWSRDDLAFALAALLRSRSCPWSLRLAGRGVFDPYPAAARRRRARRSCCAACALPAIALAPFALALRRRAPAGAHPERLHA